jgi:hypothetical protein
MKRNNWREAIARWVLKDRSLEATALHRMTAGQDVVVKIGRRGAYNTVEGEEDAS